MLFCTSVAFCFAFDHITTNDPEHRHLSATVARTLTTNYSLCSLAVPPKLAPFAIADEPLHLGDFFQLTCAVIHGDFPYNMTWLFNERPISYSSGVSILMVGKRSSSLNIDSVSGQHAGKYSCIGKNIAGSASISTSLSIRGLFVYRNISSPLWITVFF